jgi:hypothetical protein
VRSERASADDARTFLREAGVSGRGMESLLAVADCEDIFEVAKAFSRG